MKNLLAVLVALLFLAAFAFATPPTGPVPVAGPPATTPPTGTGVATAIGANGTPGDYNGNSVVPTATPTGTAPDGAPNTGLATVGTQGNSAPTAAGGSTPAYTGNVIGVLSYVPNYDVMGAHENGGRGCAGCHAPHNQARGNGGTGAAYGAFADAQGGLWGQDTSAIIAYGAGGITFNGGNSAHSGVLQWGVKGTGFSAANAWKDTTYTGVATCLSCHDGNVSTGAMMSGVSYEQYFGLLNTVGIGINTARNVGGGASVGLYGNNPIPTFLGTTGTTPNGYNGTHPVGQNANAYAAIGKTVLTNANYGLSAAVATGYYNAAAVVPNTPWGNFVASYAPGALVNLADPATGNFGDRFVVCTTCHNQHNMAVYTGTTNYGTHEAASLPSGVVQVRTIFFVNGGYNPGAPYDPTHEPSTMRFCQQCHFSMSSEYYGATNVGTAF